MQKSIRIGTRESQLAVWQAVQVKNLLASKDYAAELVYIKSEGDMDLITPLYEMGVHGIFTRSLDIALLNNRIDVAVHSLKDVPTKLPDGIILSAILERGPVNDLLVFKNREAREKYASLNSGATQKSVSFTIATSSIRRKAQWLNRYPHHRVENLRGNVNTRLKKLADADWDAAIFAQAGLERINLRPEESEIIEWMLPAPSQGAIAVACRKHDEFTIDACRLINHEPTAFCTKIERDFLRTLLGGCSTPISALALQQSGQIHFRGNILSLDGKEKITVEMNVASNKAADIGIIAAEELLNKGGLAIAETIRNGAS